MAPSIRFYYVAHVAAKVVAAGKVTIEVLPMVDENGDEPAVFHNRQEADRYVETTPGESVGGDAFLAIIETAARIQSPSGWAVAIQTHYAAWIETVEAMHPGANVTLS
jgi:hypothetical protein